MSNDPKIVTQFKVPTTAEELIADLVTRFPALKPTPQDTHATIMFAAGRRSIIDWLAERLRHQQDNPEA